MSFSAIINALSYTGSDDSKGGLWKRDAAGYELTQAPAPTPTLVWQPLIPATPFPLTLHFLPHLTVNADTGTQQPAYVALLYIEAPAADAMPLDAADTSSLGTLATGVLAWTINALLNAKKSTTTYDDLLTQSVSADDLTTLLSLFHNQPNNGLPFRYHNPAQPGLDVSGLLQQLFTVNILAADVSQKIDAAVFPPFPDLQLQDLRNGEPLKTVDFATQNPVGETYLSDLTAPLQRMDVTQRQPTQNNNTQSLPTLLFTEYVALLAQHMLQRALDCLTLAKLKDAPVGDIITSVRTKDTIAGLADMASSFLLNGLRLPTPLETGLGPVRPLYVLTGQQFTLPELAATDTYQLQLVKAATTAWIGFDGGTGLTLPVAVDDAERTRAARIAGLTLAPSLAAFPKAMANYIDREQSFPLVHPAQWQYPGTYFKDQGTDTPYLLALPANLRTELAAENKYANFMLHTLSRTDGKMSPVTQFCWATAVTVTLQKLPDEDSVSPSAANRYRLIGTNEAGIHDLHHLTSYLQTPAGQDLVGTVQLLYQTAPDTSYVSAASNTATPGDQLAMAIVAANCSTDINPELNMRGGSAEAALAPSNTLNSFADFVTLLWQCSAGHSDGYYFYYQNIADKNTGLPEALFNPDGTATVQVLITYPQFIPRPFINRVVVGDALDYSSVTVAAQSTSLLIRSAILPPGSVGYVLQRAPAAEYDPTTPTPANDQAYLENQFSLVGTALPDIPAYQNLLPVAPDTAWSYRGVVPYAQFLQPTDPLYGFADPYAGVGTAVALQLNWQDRFGNTLPFATTTGTLNSVLYYTDPLLAVSEWPLVSVGYRFVGPQDSAAPALQLLFDVPTPVRYQGDAGPGNARSDLNTWMRLWFQLQHAADLSLSFTASIDGTTAAPLGSVRPIEIEPLQTQLVRPVIDYLYALANATTPGPLPAPYTINSPIVPGSITSHVDVFPLVVSITLARTNHVDPDFAPESIHPVSGVDRVVTAIPPLAMPITEFAQQFETAFNTDGATVCLKMASAPTLSTDVGISPSLWIIRFNTSSGNQGIGLKYQLDQPAHYHAPLSLSTTLLSFGAPVAPYTTGSGSLGSPAAMNFAGIDLDLWGQQLLTAVDQFLTPAYAVPAFLLDKGASLQQVLDAKQTLAGAIAGTVDRIMELKEGTPRPNVRNAQELWCQQLLQQLGNAYSYTASVQTPVTVTSSQLPGVGNDPSVAQPRLYGQLLPVTEEGLVPELLPSFTLSSAKLPLGTENSWLDYMFQCQEMNKFRSFAFDKLRFAVSHVVWTDTPGTDTWLTLVLPTTLPASITDLGPVSVPVPLRAYPTPLYVAEQFAVHPSVNQDKLATDVLKARSWDFQFNYLTSSFAQDTIAVQMQFNGSSQENLLTQDLAPASPTLPEALAQFMSVYPALSADFDQYLTKVTGSSSGPAQAAVQVFIELVQRVATAWSAWNQINPLNPTNLRLQTFLKDSILTYQVEESPQVKTANLLITVTANPDNPLLTTALPGAPKPLLLSIDIPGYQRTATVIDDYQVQYTYTSTDPATEGQLLLYNDRNHTLLRQATAPTLDMLNQQKVWAGLGTVRNQDLLRVPGSNIEWEETNPSFVYQTPLTMSFSPLVPLSSNEDSATVGENALIDINGLPGAATPRSLLDHLTAMSTALTQQAETGITSLKVEVACQYAYDLAPGLPTTMPVLQASPFDLSTADQGQSFTQRLADALHEWQQQHQPATAGAKWLIDINTFSVYMKDSPILRLSFELKVSDISI